MNFILGNGADNKAGTSENDLIVGNLGSDTLSGLAGDDLIYGGAQGSQTYTYFDGDDVLYGNEGDDTLYGGTGNDTLSGGGDADILFGGLGNDTLYGDGGTDILLGGDGNDRLDGGLGTASATGFEDEMQGGNGNDTYVVNFINANVIDRIFEAADAGHDRVEAYVSFTLPDNVEDMNLMATAANGTGNNLRNIVVGNSVNNTLKGLGDDDALLGGGGNDAIVGGSGHDSVGGWTGNDIVQGNEGDDFLYGWGYEPNEIDRLSGGTGADTFSLTSSVKGAQYLGTGYAVINDFKHTERDKIQVSLEDASYTLGKGNQVGSSALDTLIYCQNNLVAIVADTLDVVLSRDFVYQSIS